MNLELLAEAGHNFFLIQAEEEENRDHSPKEQRPCETEQKGLQNIKVSLLKQSRQDFKTSN